MRHLVFTFILTFSAAAFAAPEECPDLSGSYFCQVTGAQGEFVDEFSLLVSFSGTRPPKYSLIRQDRAHDSYEYIADEQIHDGPARGLQYRAVCSEKGLIIKHYSAQKAVDVRVYTKGKDGFMVDTLAGERELCKIALP